MSEGEVNEEAVKGLIDEAFAAYDTQAEALVLYRFVGKGIDDAVFTLESRIGSVKCAYPLRQVAADLLRKYPPETSGNIAFTKLSLILGQIHIGLPNV